MESDGPAPDQNVSALVQIDGGTEQQERVQRTFDDLGWPHREPASDDTPPDGEDGASFRCVDIPVPGSRLCAGREAHWLLQDVAKREQLPITGRAFHAPPGKRGRKGRMWQAYLGTAHSGPRATLHHLAALTGRFDIGPRVTGDRLPALAFALASVPVDQIPSVQVRRTGRIPLLLVSVLALGLFLALMRTDTGAPGTNVPTDQSTLMLRDEPLDAGFVRIDTPWEMVLYPAYYIVGLILFCRRQRWTTLSVTVLPLLVALLTLVLPSAGRLVMDAYAEGLGLRPNDLPMSSWWQLVAGTHVALPVFASVLFSAATWGYLRHFHLVRRSSVVALTAVIVLTTFTVVVSVRNVVQESSQEARGLLTPPSTQATATLFSGLMGKWYCVQPTVPTGELSTHGDRPLKPSRPYMSFDIAADPLVLLPLQGRSPLYVKSDQVRLVSVLESSNERYYCPTQADTDGS